MNAFIKKIQTALNDRGYGPLKLMAKTVPKPKKPSLPFRKMPVWKPMDWWGPSPKTGCFGNSFPSSHSMAMAQPPTLPGPNSPVTARALIVTAIRV